MISLNTEATTILLVVLGQLVITIPLAFTVLRAWLTVKENQYKIQQLPTREEVNNQVNGVVNRLLNESNGTTGKGGAP